VPCGLRLRVAGCTCVVVSWTPNVVLGLALPLRVRREHRFRFVFGFAFPGMFMSAFSVGSAIGRPTYHEGVGSIPDRELKRNAVSYQHNMS